MFISELYLPIRAGKSLDSPVPTRILPAPRRRAMLYVEHCILPKRVERYISDLVDTTYYITTFYFPNNNNLSAFPLRFPPQCDGGAATEPVASEERLQRGGHV